MCWTFGAERMKLVKDVGRDLVGRALSLRQGVFQTCHGGSCEASKMHMLSPIQWIGEVSPGQSKTGETRRSLYYEGESQFEASCGSTKFQRE